MQDNGQTKKSKMPATSVGNPDTYVLGLLDPHPDPLVRGTDLAPDPDLDPSIIKQKK
jgi:hypothetical protein